MRMEVIVPKCNKVFRLHFWPA